MGVSKWECREQGHRQNEQNEQNQHRAAARGRRRRVRLIRAHPCPAVVKMHWILRSLRATEPFQRFIASECKWCYHRCHRFNDAHTELSPGKMQGTVRFRHKKHDHNELRRPGTSGRKKNSLTGGGTDPSENVPQNITKTRHFRIHPSRFSDLSFSPPFNASPLRKKHKHNGLCNMGKRLSQKLPRARV